MTDIGIRLRKALEGRYAVEHELGHGGMATVHLAEDVKHGRRVAIKVLRPELAQALGGERFLREINIAAKLQSPHILPLLDSGEADGLLYYVMPYVEGASLRTLLVEQGALAPSEAMRLLRDIVDGIAHAHRQGIVHRDIKPDNVMIADRHALVVDFGIAKAVSDASAHHDLTSIGISLGTPAYMAPEQAAADPGIDHRADIYSVGALAYELLTGAAPFTGSPQAIIAAQISSTPAPLAQARPEVPAAVAQIVMRCLEKDPAARYQTADELLQAIEGLVTPMGALAAGSPPPRARRWVVRGSALVVIAVAAFFTVQRVQQDRWLHGTALPELRRLVEDNEQDSAYALALQVEAVASRDSTLLALWPRFARKSVIHSQPEGARVYRASFADTSVWRDLGTTPTDTVWLPTNAGLFRYELAGHRPVVRLSRSRPNITLFDAIDAPDAEMIRIPGGRFRAFLVGTDGVDPVELGEFKMDRYEITNAQYQKFVDAGGYRDQSHWEHPIRDGARTLAWSEAMARFVDRTGRPGPASWEAGGYPVGKGELPVGGVSWYEAAAYAKFAGKSLPTLYHWSQAAAVQNSKFMIPESNLEGTGPLPVGTPRGVSAAGVSDLAGNVREWVLNDAGRGQRFILGGGWSDPTYGLVDAYAQRPLDRSPINGIRLVRYAADEPNLATASQPIPRAFRDYSRETPVPNAVFAGFLQLYDYDPIALSPIVESMDSTSASMIVERVSFAAAYGGERMAAWIYRPRVASGPLQTVVFFPGSGSINGGPSAGVFDATAEWVVRSGRAFVVPIYKSTHERTDSLRSDYADMSIFYRDHVVMWAKDYRRTLDYLSTRAEFDSTRFAYFGVSWGGLFGGLVPAVEPRIKAVVLYVAGLAMEGARPEVDIVNFLPRVRQPVLMLNGRYDYFFPLETAQQPFFRILGTPAADKRYLVYEGGHDVPRTELIKESLAWFDKYLGPVR